MMSNKIFFVMFCFFMVCVVNSDCNTCCFQCPSITSTPQPQPNGTVIQGRPGKIGPAGPPGPVGSMGIRGDKGERGECSCNRSEIEELKQTLQDTVARLNTAISIEELCYAGVKDGRIPNSAMSASTIWSIDYSAYYARLDSSKTWHPASDSYAGAWLQVDLGQETRVHGVVTQGRPNGDQWITSFRILSGKSLENLEIIDSGQNDGDKQKIGFRHVGQDTVIPGKIIFQLETMQLYLTIITTSIPIILTKPKSLLSDYFTVIFLEKTLHAFLGHM